MNQEPYFKMDMQSLPVSPAAAFGEALLLHDNLESDVDWDKAAFGIPIKLTGAMMLFFCLSGEVRLEDNQQEVVLTRGDVIIKVSGSMGYVRSMSPDIRFALVIMDKSFYFPILGSSRLASVQERLQVQPICHLEATSLQECMDIYARMRFSMGLKHEMPLRRGFLQCSLETILFILCSHLMHDVTKARKSSSSEHQRQRDLFNQFSSLVETHFIQERGISFYADKLCVTPRYLSRVVLAASGRHASEHIDNRMLAEAKQLIRSGRYTMLQISEMLNFATPSLFGRYFKKHTGKTPKQFQ